MRSIRSKVRIRKKKQKKVLLILFMIVLTIVIFLFTGKKEIKTFGMNQEFLKTQNYAEVDKEKDKIVKSIDGDKIGIEFDVFFKKDKNGDGIAESIRGTCNQIGKEANLYMELGVQEGYIKDSVITINSDNFYLNTSIIKDNEISNNYISNNTKTIELNRINSGTEKILIGTVRSGDYSSSITKTSAIGNDSSKYSKENYVTFSGVFVNSAGEEKEFSKNIPIIVDWYGEVNCNIIPQIQNQSYEILRREDGIHLDFTITTSEMLNELIMYGSYISGTIPKLNGYHPTVVEITGENVKYTYDNETGKFTAQREAKIDEKGKIVSNAYSYLNSEIKYNNYQFSVIYPLQAYDEIEDNISNFELTIPLEATNKGFNNSDKDVGFENPVTSNKTNGIVTVKNVNGQLQLKTIVGDEAIRYFSNSKEVKALNIVNLPDRKNLLKTANKALQMVNIYKTDEESGAAVSGAKFVIKDLNDKVIDETLITDEDGYCSSTNLPDGFYKAIETEAPEGYILPENENERTYNFRVGLTGRGTWLNSVKGNGWDYINSVEGTKDGGIVSVGSFSYYSNTIASGANNGVDVNNDNNIDKTSRGDNDGLITSYDLDGVVTLNKRFGGTEDDSLNKIIQTSDGGYAIVGYTSSKEVYLENTLITDLSRYDNTFSGKDAVLLKLTPNFEYDWGIRIDSLGDGEAKSVIETTENNLVIVGYNLQKGFIASYSLSGDSQWNTELYSGENFSGTPKDVRDVAESWDETSNYLLVAVGNGIEIFSLSGENLHEFAYWRSKPICLDTTLDGKLVIGSVCAYKWSPNGARWNLAIDITDGWLNLKSEYFCQLHSEGDDYVADVKATSDGGIIFGGWYLRR